MHSSSKLEEIMKLQIFVDEVIRSNNSCLTKWQDLPENEFLTSYRMHNGNMDALFECILWNMFRFIPPSSQDIEHLMSLGLLLKMTHDSQATEDMDAGVAPRMRVEDELISHPLVQRWLKEAEFPAHGYLILQGNVSIEVDESTFEALKFCGIDDEYLLTEVHSDQNSLIPI